MPRPWLRIGHAGEDSLVEGLVASATARVEAETGRALIIRQMRETLDAGWCGASRGCGSAFAIGPSPLVSVEAIRNF